MSEIPPPELNMEAAPKKIAKDSPFKHGDFWLGFFGSIVVNSLIAALGIFASTSNFSSSELVGFLLGALPWVLNIGAIILFLVIKRSRIVLGILFAYAVGFALVLIAGLFIAVVCFYSLSKL